MELTCQCILRSELTGRRHTLELTVTMRTSGSTSSEVFFNKGRRDRVSWRVLKWLFGRESKYALTVVLFRLT